VEVPVGGKIQSISTWLGSEFGSPKYTSSSGLRFVNLDSEVRTERLLVVIQGTPSAADLAENMILVMPEPPAGIELRIDGGAPVFSQLAAVDPSTSADLTGAEWNAQGQRVVDLAPDLAAVLGDPLDDTTVTLHARLSSRVPGKLDLQRRDGGQDTAIIRRAVFNGQPTLDINFEKEGLRTVVLDSLPADLNVLELHARISGTPPTERITPPVGPEAPDPGLAAFTLTPNRATCVRLPEEPRLAELNGVRFPLAVGESGAEARVLLWRSADITDLSPKEPLEAAASESVALEAGPEAWRTFRWKQPVPAPQTVWPLHET
jgi:hypothetical protein